MPTQEERLSALEKDTATMKRDIIYKLDDTNSAVTMIKGIAGNQGQDIKEIKYQMKMVNVHLDGIDTRLEGMKEEIRAVKDQQDRQGQDITDIKRHLQEHTTVLQEHTTILQEHTTRFDRLETILAQILARLPEKS